LHPSDNENPANPHTNNNNPGIPKTNHSANWKAKGSIILPGLLKPMKDAIRNSAQSRIIRAKSAESMKTNEKDCSAVR
jgi:hypothetical protein